MPYVHFNKSICFAIQSGDMHRALADGGHDVPLYVIAREDTPYVSFLYGSQALCDRVAGTLSPWVWRGEKKI